MSPKPLCREGKVERVTRFVGEGGVLEEEEDLSVVLYTNGEGTEEWEPARLERKKKRVNVG